MKNNIYLQAKHNVHINGVLPQLLLTGILAFMILYLSLASPFFMSWDNFRNILDHSALYVVLALGMTFVISTAGIDLSVGAVAALSGISMAVAMKNGLPVEISILLGLAVGVLVGSFNGAVVSCLNINPFIVTLATMSVSRGLALIITGGIPVYGFPSAFTWWGSGHVGALNPPILMAFGMAILAALILNKTKLGYYTLALGGNEEALRRSGVSVKKYKTVVYAMCGLTAALAGLIVTARLNTAEPLAGWMFELDAIAAVVLGGTSMNGGRGSIGGTLIACLLLGVLRNGLTILSIPSYYQQLIMGAIILVAVIVSELRAREEVS